LGAAWIVREWYRAGGDWQARARACAGSCYRTAPLWVLFVVYWAFAIGSHLNIGHRHLLPTYPPMFILAGASWYWLGIAGVVGSRGSVRAPRLLVAGRWSLTACVVLICIALFAAESLWRWPNYLAYFNQIAGGPANGYRHMVDSSLDWGQDLPELRRWLVKNRLNTSPNENTYLSYFGVSNPRYHGIKAKLLPCYPERPTNIPEQLQPGAYCVSATMLQNVYNPQFRGSWNQEFEAAYQKLASNVGQFQKATDAERQVLVTNNGEDFWRISFELYEQARFARLAGYLRQREPEAQINYSILIYQLTAADLDRALNRPVSEMDSAPAAGS